MITEEYNRRLLQVSKMKSRLKPILTIILQDIAGPNILILGLKEEAILRSNLKFDLPV